MTTPLEDTNAEVIKEFEEKFGVAGEERNCDSIGREAGCDDCGTNIELREEHKDFLLSKLSQAYDLGKEEERARLLNQPANKHDQEVREEERKRLLGEMPEYRTDRVLVETEADRFYNFLNKDAKKGYKIALNDIKTIITNLGEK